MLPFFEKVYHSKFLESYKMVKKCSVVDYNQLTTKLQINQLQNYQPLNLFGFKLIYKTQPKNICKFQLPNLDIIST